MANTPAHRRAAFRTLHERGCFVMPNPSDVGSARMLQSLGFPALATSSAGMAFSLGLPDGRVPRAAVLEHVKAIAGAIDVPLNADFESGFGADPAAVAESVARCVATGVAGLSIEDATGDRAAPLFEPGVAVERLRAARAAIDASGTGVILTARAECHLVGTPNPLRDSIRRLEAYAAAGADCLYAPGLTTSEEVLAVVKAVAPRPVNVLAGGRPSRWTAPGSRRPPHQRGSGARAHRLGRLPARRPGDRGEGQLRRFCGGRALRPPERLLRGRRPPPGRMTRS